MICPSRSNHHLQALPHLFTSSIKTGSAPSRPICSWCGRAKDGKPTANFQRSKKENTQG